MATESLNSGRSDLEWFDNSKCWTPEQPSSLLYFTATNKIQGPPPIGVEYSDHRPPRRRRKGGGWDRKGLPEMGFFQVVNHGIPVEILEEIMDGIRRFHEQDPELKKQFYSRYQSKKVSYFSNFDLFRSKAANWRDTLPRRSYLQFAGAVLTD